MLEDERFRHEELVALLGNYVEELLVECHGRQQLDRFVLDIFQVRGVLMLAVHREFRHELLATNGALDCVGAQVLLEAGEKFLFAERLFALRTRFFDVEIERIFQNVAEFHGVAHSVSLLGIQGCLLGQLMRLSPVEDILEVNDTEVLFLHLTHALFGGTQLSLA